MNIEPLKALWPRLNDDELADARENLDAYLALAWEIYEDIQEGAVDRLPVPPYDLEERSIPPIN